MMRNLWPILFLLALVGCAASPAATLEPTPTDEPTSAPIEPDVTPTLLLDNLLVSVQRFGGLCPNGVCDSMLFINADGALFTGIADTRWHTPMPQGTLTPDELSELQRLIAQTDFAAIKAVPFTDICPVAYDGQEVIYNFYLENDVIEHLASCEVVIDPTLPLFAWLDALMERVIFSN